MKTKILVVLMCAACVISLPVFAGGKSETADTSLAKIKEKGNFVLGLDDSFPPMGFRDDSGNIVGFDIDLAKANVTRPPTPFQSAEHRPQEGRGDEARHSDKQQGFVVAETAKIDGYALLFQLLQHEADERHAHKRQKADKADRPHPPSG